MDHEAEGYSESHVESPRDRTPVEQRKDAGPVLDAAHGKHVGFIRVDHPLAEGIEQDVRGDACREHHGTPVEKAVLGFPFAEVNIPEARKCHVERDEEDAQAEGQIIPSEFFAEEGANAVHHGGRACGIGEEGKAQCDNAEEGDQCDDPVDPVFQCLVHFYINPPDIEQFIIYRDGLQGKCLKFFCRFQKTL